MRSAATDAAAVEAAQVAVNAAEASRQRGMWQRRAEAARSELQNAGNRRGRRRETLTTALANKAPTDKPQSST